MPISYTRENNTVALITMDSGENRHNPEFVKNFLDALDAIEADKSFKAVVICSKDDKFWSLGIDTAYTGKAVAEGRLQELKDFLYSCNALFKRILTYPMPVIAAVGGHAFGNGAIFAMACDYRFMKSDKGFFCYPEVDINIAFLPSALAISKKTIPAWFLEDLALSGRKVGAAEMEQVHLVRKACENEEALIRESIAFASTFNKAYGIFAEHKRRMHKQVLEVIDKEDPLYVEPLNITA